MYKRQGRTSVNLAGADLDGASAGSDASAQGNSEDEFVGEPIGIHQGALNLGKNSAYALGHQDSGLAGVAQPPTSVDTSSAGSSSMTVEAPEVQRVLDD